MPRENPLSSLSLFVPQIFQDVQKTVINHRKNAVVLRKFQFQCSQFNDDNHNFGENEFNKEFVRNVNKILPVKKGQANAERVITFIATFVNYCQEKENERGSDSSDTIDNDSTLLSRFTGFLLRHFLKGIEAKDKNVRLRVCQLIGLVIDSIEVIDGDLYEHLKDELTKRLLDKESSIRVKAVEACSKLQCEEIGKDIVEKLLGIMQNDPIAEVRRAVLLNIDLNENTIPHIFDRTRDADASIRRDVYVRSSEEIGDFRVLSIETREKLLRNGLTDRDPQVNKACSNFLAYNWVQHANNNLLELLKRIDVVGSNVAQDALLTIFKSRPDLMQTLNFDESFWEGLTIESVFLVQVFCEFNKEDENKLDEVLPEVSKFALYIQKHINLMQEAFEEDIVSCEFIVGQLLIISKFLDYGDEIGRRKMFNLLREVLMLNHVPDDHIESIVEVMKKLSIDERDFARSMAEILNDIREKIETENDQGYKYQIEDELSASILNLSIRSGSSERSMSTIDSKFTLDDEDRKLTTKITNIKCLNIVRYILERSEESLRNNPSMYGILNEFILPNLQSPEPMLHELSIHCLGLSCLLDQRLTDDKFGLFIYCAGLTNPELQNKALMVIFDIVMMYSYPFVVENIRQGDQILELLCACLHNENPVVLATTVEGIAKLMLSQMIYDKNILKELVILYFDVETATNTRLRQCLSYFFPVYCHSSVENQRLMLQIFVPSLVNLMDEYRQLKNKEMIPPLQIAQQLIDWADPSKVVKSEQNEEIIEYGAHADIAIDIIKELFRETNKELRKIYCLVLNKLNIDESAGTLRFKKLTLLTGNLKTKKPLIDAVSRNALKKFEDSILRFYNDAPEPLNDNELEQLKEILEFIKNVHEEPSLIRVTRSSTRNKTESFVNYFTYQDYQEQKN
ncbi:unnamed protein product [Rhizophagus irregularis]|nr:unnamed protein product [Rhizophagus irregularis]